MDFNFYTSVHNLKLMYLTVNINSLSQMMSTHNRPNKTVKAV